MACSWCKRGSILLIASVAILAAVIARFSFSHTRLSLPATVYWGPRRVPPGSAPPKDDESIKEFTINFEADLIARLREDIKTSTWVDPLEDNAYHDGVNLRTFRDLMEYWRTKYDFNKSLAEINAYPHYKTEIEGLKIHFLQSKAEPKSKNVEVIPLLLIHGWPGSFAEFLKVIPLLNAAKNGIAFDVVVPSLPGFGYSDAPSRRGVDAVVAARIFKTLMARLGYSRYIVQGGDWGSVVTSAMGSLFPDDVRGIHLNLLFSFPLSFMDLSKLLLVRTFPKYFTDGPLPRCMSFEAKGAFQEMAYFYMQATKPDTLGLAHLNSAVGLAAYIMEKFAVATDPKYLDLDDGGFGRRIPLDHVFTNLMVYYTSKSAISSYRFYKENIVTGNFFHLYKDPIKVPTGYAIFPNDISCSPTFIAKGLLPNLTTLTYQKSGGHFAAMEEPAALADDIRQFVEKLVELYPERR